MIELAGERWSTTRCSFQRVGRGSRSSSASRSRSRPSRSTPGCPTRTSRRRRRSRVILAGVLLKMGTYGILRINFAHPAGGDAHESRLLAARRARHVQHRLRRAVRDGADRLQEAGRLSLGQPHGLRDARHGGASPPQGINGAVLQMFNHGTITAMLFLLVGVIYDRAHHRDIDGFGGLASIDAALHRRHRLRVLRRDGPARALGLHLRGAGAARRVAALPGADDLAPAPRF